MKKTLIQDEQLLQSNDTASALSHTESSSLVESSDLRLYMKIIEATRDAIVLVDSSGHIKLWNTAATKLFGWTKQEIQNQNVHALLAPHNVQQKASEALSEFRNSGTGSLINKISIHQCKHKDGHLLPVELALGGMQLDDENYAVATIRDISMRLQAELTVRKSEEKYKALFEDSRDALMTLCPPDWFFGNCNSATLKMFGTNSKEEFVSRNPWDYSPEYQPDGRLSIEKAQEMIGIAVKEGSHFFEWTHKRLDGVEFPVTVLLTKTKIADEETIMACVRDITQQKAQETELRKWAEIFKHAKWGIAVSSVETRNLTIVNPQFAEMHGYSQEELIGKPIDVHCSSETLKKLPRKIAIAYANGHHVFESIHRRKDGTAFPVRINITVPKRSNGDPLYGIWQIVDITKEVEDKREKEELERRYFQAQKMEAIGTLAGGVAHDFNNLLTIILSNADFIRADLTKGSMMEQDILQILSSAKKAAELTKGLLAFSRKQSLKETRVDLNEVIQEFLPTLRHIIGEDIFLDQNFEHSLPDVMVDQAQIASIIANLVTNARHAMPEGGHLSITTDHVTFNENNVPSCENAKAGNYVVLTISDTGTGIPEDKLPRIFEPFFTTKEVGIGTGLGLSMVQGSVIQQRGFIDVKTKVGKGTKFLIYFPALVREQRKLLIETKVEQDMGHETILVVEDEEAVRKVVTRILRQYGYTVLEADNAGTADMILEKRTEKQEPVDMVLTDVRMPMISGTDLGNRIKTKYPDITVVYMSGYPKDSDSQFQESHFIPKPFDTKHIAGKIRDILDEKKSK